MDLSKLTDIIEALDTGLDPRTIEMVCRLPRAAEIAQEQIQAAREGIMEAWKHLLPPDTVHPEIVHSTLFEGSSASTSSCSISRSTSELYFTAPSTPPEFGVDKLQVLSTADLPESVVRLVLEHLVSPWSRVSPTSCDLEATAFHTVLSLYPGWKQIALKHPDLWGKILRVDSDNLSDFETYLQLSKHSPLHFVSSPQHEPLSEERLVVWRLASNQLSRCATLSIGIGLPSLDTRPLHLFLSHPAPQLEHAIFESLPPRSYQNTMSSHPEDSIFKDIWPEHAPILRTFRLRGCLDLFDLRLAPFNSLTVLEVSNDGRTAIWPLARWIATLSRLTRLRHLKIVNAILVPRHAAPSCCCDRCLSSIPLQSLSTFSLTSHILVAEPLLYAMDLSAHTSVSIRLHNQNGPVNGAQRLLDSPDYMNACFSRGFSCIPPPVHVIFDTWQIKVGAHVFQLRLRSREGITSSVALDFVDLSVSFGQWQSILCSVLHRIKSDIPRILLRVEHLGITINCPLSPDVLHHFRLFLAHLSATVSLQLDDGAVRRLCPSILRESPLDDEPVFGAPLPSLAKIWINASIMDDLTTWNAFLSYLERPVDTPFETVAFVAIEDEGRDVSKKLWEAFSGSDVFKYLDISIGIARHGIVHTAFCSGRLGNAVPAETLGWGDRGTLKRVVAERLGDGSD